MNESAVSEMAHLTTTIIQNYYFVHSSKRRCSKMKDFFYRDQSIFHEKFF